MSPEKKAELAAKKEADKLAKQEAAKKQASADLEKEAKAKAKEKLKAQQEQKARELAAQREKEDQDALIQKLMAAKSGIGIQQTQEVWRFIASSVDAYKAAKADGVINGRDLALIITPATLLAPAIDRGGEIFTELGDLDPMEKAMLYAEFDQLVDNDAAQRAFAAFVEFGDAMLELTGKGTVNG